MDFLRIAYGQESLDSLLFSAEDLPWEGTPYQAERFW